MRLKPRLGAAFREMRARTALDADAGARTRRSARPLRAADSFFNGRVERRALRSQLQLTCNCA